MSDTIREIKFHHFDDEPLRIVQIPGVLFNLMWLKWPDWIRTEEPLRSERNGCDCHSFSLHLGEKAKIHVQYLFYTDRDVFMKHCLPAPQDVVLLDLMKPGANGILEKQGIDCFNAILKHIPIERIFVVSAYSDQFCTEQGVCTVDQQCYSKPINTRALCEMLIGKVENYVKQT